MSGISFSAYLATFSALIPVTLCITYLFEGEACTLKDGGDGICGKFSDCESAFNIPRNRPVMCSPRGVDDIICCPPEYIQKPTQRKDFPDTETCSLLVERDTKQIEESLSGRACQMYYNTFIHNSEHDNILGGIVIEDMSQHPYMAVLFNENYVAATNTTKINYFCGGALISDRFVLTAAHCEQGDLRVRMGAANLDQSSPDSNIFDMEKFITHPCYNMQDSYYDIALIKLTKRIQVTDFIFPACIFMHPEPEFNKEYNVSGWGTTTDTGHRRSSTLREASVTVFHPDICGSKWTADDQTMLVRGFASNTMFCAVNPNKSACGGDSGGPLFLRYPDNHGHFTVIGVVSQGGSGCGDPNKPSIFTNIYPFLLWIEDVIWPDGNILPLQWVESVPDDYKNNDDCEEGSGFSC